MKEIVIYKGPEKNHPLSIETRENGECIGGTYISSFQELIQILTNMEARKEIPWNDYEPLDTYT